MHGCSTRAYERQNIHITSFVVHVDARNMTVCRDGVEMEDKGKRATDGTTDSRRGHGGLKQAGTRPAVP